MLSITREVLFLILLIIINGLFAMSEIAVVSARKTRLERLSEKGDRRAKAALKLANNPNQILSTVQIGITLVGIFAGAYGGATLAAKLANFFKEIYLFPQHSDAIALTLVVLIITYLSLVLGELVPKRLGLSNPEPIACRVALPLSNLSKLTAPVVYFLSISTDLILKLFFSQQQESEATVTRTEIKVLVEQGTEAGIIDAAEQEMVQRVLQLNDYYVSGLMTPRRNIAWLNLNDSLEENRQKIIKSNYTHFPVCENNLDHVVGTVQVSDLLTASLQGQPFDLTQSLRPPLFVPESTKGLKVLELFKRTQIQIALVVDEYGVIQGLVTLNEVLEAIIGNLPSTRAREDAKAVQREDGSWLIDGSYSIEDFRSLFEVPHFPGDHRGNYRTLGGFILSYLGRIPVAAEHFQWNGLRFEVMDMDGNRVDKVLVTVIAP
jgi:putative hemolysin